MEPIPKLNRPRPRWPFGSLLVALAVAMSVGSMRQRLTAIYAGPAAVAATSETAGRAPRREDAKLFSNATENGLLRLDTDGRIAVAPADLPLRRAYARVYPDLLAPRSEGPDWLAGAWNDEIRRLHQALHFSAAGRYVRQQVEAFNARQLLAGVRWRSDGGFPGAWTADWAGAPLALTAASLAPNELFLDDGSGDWQPWQWVTRWPALENRPPARFRLRPLRPVRAGERLEVLVVGGAPEVRGATVVSREPRCRERLPCSESGALAYRLRLEWREGSAGLTVTCAPLAASRIPELWRQDVTQIRREGERLLWKEPTEAGASAARPAATEPELVRVPSIRRESERPASGDNPRAANSSLQNAAERLALSAVPASRKRR